MTRRAIGRGAALVVLVAAGAAVGWLLSLPSASAGGRPAPLDPRERAAIVAGLTPRTRARPVIAVIGLNEGTETTDYLMPTGILRRADIAEVRLLSTGSGPVRLYPALRVEADATVDEFDRQHPSGADIVIVPAMHRDDDPVVLGWLRRQAARGAQIIGVCAGAKVVGAAGLLKSKRATTHWYYLRELQRANPTTVYVRDRRLVVDGNVVTTTGITASMPAALMLVEAVAGRSRAAAVARDLGLSEWDAGHDSSAFRLTRPFALTVMANRLMLWNREALALELTPGIDEVTLALVADAWSRTYRSRATTFSRGDHAVTSANGIRVIPDGGPIDPSSMRSLPALGGRKPADVLDATLAAIEARYGPATADVVAMQLEYPHRRRGR